MKNIFAHIFLAVLFLGGCSAMPTDINAPIETNVTSDNILIEANAPFGDSVPCESNIPISVNDDIDVLARSLMIIQSAMECNENQAEDIINTLNMIAEVGKINFNYILELEVIEEEHYKIYTDEYSIITVRAVSEEPYTYYLKIRATSTRYRIIEVRANSIEGECLYKMVK